MAEQTKISIIVPVYNVESFLARCLDSLCGQTLKEIEIICVNDGSTDGCAEILQRYAAADNRIKVINKENGGPSKARNAGIAIAAGEYVGFADSDDWVDDTFFEMLYNRAQQEDADIVRGPYQNVLLGKTSRKGNLNDKLEICLKKNLNLTMHDHAVVIWDAIYRRNYFQKIGVLNFDEALQATEDLLFTTQLMVLSRKTVSAFGAYYYHLIDGRETVGSFSMNNLYNTIAANHKTVEYINQCPNLNKNDYMKIFERCIKRYHWRFFDLLSRETIGEKDLKFFAAVYLDDFHSCLDLKAFYKFCYEPFYRFLLKRDIDGYIAFLNQRAKKSRRRLFAIEFGASHNAFHILGIKIKFKSGISSEEKMFLKRL